MITNIGKSIIAKYLIGDAPAYASFIALGCGAAPRNNINTATGVSSSGTTFTTTSTAGLWVGAQIVKESGTGTLSTLENTIVTSISSETQFVVNRAPTQNFSSATLKIQTNSEKNALDFEMFRVPISSRGYVNDNGVNKIVLTAQLPTEERYEISEIGVYSAGSNSAAGKFDSKTISAFSGEEIWELVLGGTRTSASASNQNFPESQNSIVNGSNIISVDLEATSTPETLQPLAIKTTTSNAIFSNDERLNRYERPRYLSSVLLLRGDSSSIYSNGTSISPYGDKKFLQTTGLPIDLTKNSSSDIMKLAFSIISVDGQSEAIPEAVNIIIEFSNSGGTQYAWMQVEAKSPSSYSVGNRYVVATKRLDELFYSSELFSWLDVSVVKVYVTTTQTISVTNKKLTSNVAVITTGAPHGFAVGDYVRVRNVDSVFNGIHLITGVDSNTFTYTKTNTNVSTTTSSGTVEFASDQFYVALDALRLDNISTINPIYGLTGYSIVQNDDKLTILKQANTTNYIEYRFVLDVT
jgi:hypothetical protein